MIYNNYMNKLVKRINKKRFGGEYGSYKAPVRKHSETVIEWISVDLDGVPLGRSASKIASILQGKHDCRFTPNVRAFGVICKNPKNAVLTGNKEENTVFYRHSGYLGGLKEFGYDKISSIDRVIRTVKGMVAKKTYLQRNMKKFLKFEGEI